MSDMAARYGPAVDALKAQFPQLTTTGETFDFGYQYAVSVSDGTRSKAWKLTAWSPSEAVWKLPDSVGRWMKNG